MTESEALERLIAQNTAVHAAKERVVKVAEDAFSNSRGPIGWAIGRLRAARKRQAKAREILEKVRGG